MLGSWLVALTWRTGVAVGGHAGPVQRADQGQRLRGRVGLRDGPAGRLAGPHRLGHAGRAHRAGQRGLRPAAVQRRELHRCVHDGRGRLGRSLLRSAHSNRHRRRSHADVTGAVLGSSLSITGAASVGLLSSATGITGSTLTINNTANAGNFTTVGDVSTGTLTASGAATAASFAASGAVTGATLTITGAASAGPLDCESLDCTFTATSDTEGRPQKGRLCGASKPATHAPGEAKKRQCAATRMPRNGPQNGTLYSDRVFLERRIIQGHALQGGPAPVCVRLRRSVDGQRGARRRDKLGHGLRPAALRVQHAHRDQHLRLLGRSLLDEELGGLSAASDSGPELRLLGNQSAQGVFPSSS